LPPQAAKYFLHNPRPNLIWREAPRKDFLHNSEYKILPLKAAKAFSRNRVKKPSDACHNKK